MDITNIAFNEDGSMTVTKSDGSTVGFTNSAPVVAPTDEKVEITDTAGTVKTFVLQAE